MGYISILKLAKDSIDKNWIYPTDENRNSCALFYVAAAADTLGKYSRTGSMHPDWRKAIDVLHEAAFSYCGIKDITCSRIKNKNTLLEIFESCINGWR